MHWIRRFIHFHGMRHPLRIGAEEVHAFLCHLADRENVSASTQNQALSRITSYNVCYTKLLRSKCTNVLFG